MLELLVLVAFEDVQEDLRIRLVGLELDFLHGQKPDNDRDLLIFLKTADHRSIVKIS